MEMEYEEPQPFLADACTHGHIPVQCRTQKSEILYAGLALEHIHLGYDTDADQQSEIDWAIAELERLILLLRVPGSRDNILRPHQRLYARSALGWVTLRCYHTIGEELSMPIPESDGGAYPYYYKMRDVLTWDMA